MANLNPKYPKDQRFISMLESGKKNVEQVHRRRPRDCHSTATVQGRFTGAPNICRRLKQSIEWFFLSDAIEFVVHALSLTKKLFDVFRTKCPHSCWQCKHCTCRDVITDRQTAPRGFAWNVVTMPAHVYFYVQYDKGVLAPNESERRSNFITSREMNTC